MIEGLERWEDLLFCPDTPNPPKSELIWKERNQLQGKCEREIYLCERDAPELHAELKKLWKEYLDRRCLKVTKYMKDVESLKSEVVLKMLTNIECLD